MDEIDKLETIRNEADLEAVIKTALKRLEGLRKSWHVVIYEDKDGMVRVSKPLSTLQDIKGVLKIMTFYGWKVTDFDGVSETDPNGRTKKGYLWTWDYPGPKEQGEWKKREEVIDDIIEDSLDDILWDIREYLDEAINRLFFARI